MVKGKEQTERLREDETYVDHVRYLKGSGDSEQDEVTLPVGQLQVVDGVGGGNCRMAQLDLRHQYRGQI